MGLAASSGRDNDDLVDKLVEANIIVTHRVETVLRLVDRGRFFPEEGRDIAYKDLAWKSDFGSPGRIHISAPCIYANVLEYLDLQEGNSFLNIGSGTGYLSTVAGYLIGSTGTNHGIEIHSNIIQYARGLVNETLHRQETQCYDWGVPEFACGNGLFLSPAHYGKYDRVYCGAAVPGSHRRILWELLKIGGILVMPFDDQLQQVRRKAPDMFEVKIITSVSFSDFILPTEEETSKALYSSAPAFSPLPTLQYLCASFIRKTVRAAVGQTHEIHIRNLVSQQPKRARESHTVFEFRDGEQPPVDEARIENRHPQLRQIFAIVRPELERRDLEAHEEFDNENDNEDDDVDAEERRRLIRERHRLEWFRQRLRAHIANRAARRRRLREAEARQHEVNVELDDDNHQSDDAQVAGQNENSESSGSGSLSTASSNPSNVAETNSDGTSGGAGRSKKRTLLEQEGESSLSAKRRNGDDDNSRSSEEPTTAMEINQASNDHETAQNTHVQNLSQESVSSKETTAKEMIKATETKEDVFHALGETENANDAVEEPMEPVEELGKFAETLTDKIIEQSQASLEKGTKSGEGTGAADNVSEAMKSKIPDENLSSGNVSAKIQEGKVLNDDSSIQRTQESNRSTSNSSLSIQAAAAAALDDVRKPTDDQKPLKNDVMNSNKLEGSSSEVNPGTDHGYVGKAERSDDDEEFAWQNNKLFRSKAETSAADGQSNQSDVKTANTDGSSHDSEDFKTAESEMREDDDTGWRATGIESMDHSDNDDNSVTSASSDDAAAGEEDVMQRSDDNDDDDDDDIRDRDEHHLYSAARDAAESIGAAAAIGIEEAAAADSDSESVYTNSDLSSDEYRDAMADDMPSRRDDLVPDELQTEEAKQRERARLEECERQRKDIEKFAFLFERRLMELPLNNALKHYIKYLC